MFELRRRVSEAGRAFPGHGYDVSADGQRILVNVRNRGFRSDADHTTDELDHSGETLKPTALHCRRQVFRSFSGGRHVEPPNLRETGFAPRRGSVPRAVVETDRWRAKDAIADTSAGKVRGVVERDRQDIQRHSVRRPDERKEPLHAARQARRLDRDARRARVRANRAARRATTQERPPPGRRRSKAKTVSS